MGLREILWRFLATLASESSFVLAEVLANSLGHFSHTLSSFFLRPVLLQLFDILWLFSFAQCAQFRNTFLSKPRNLRGYIRRREKPVMAVFLGKSLVCRRRQCSTNTRRF